MLKRMLQKMNPKFQYQIKIPRRKKKLCKNMHKLNHTYSIVCLCKVIGFVQRYNGCDSFCIHAIGCTNIMASVVVVDERVRAWAQTNGWVRMEEGVVTHIHYERCVFQMNLSKRVPFVTSASVNLTLKTYSKPSKFDLYGKTVEK